MSASMVLVPTTEHMAVYRNDCRLATDEDLLEWRARAAWRVTLADADDTYSAAVTAQSRLDALAEITAIDRERAFRSHASVHYPRPYLGFPTDWLADLKQRARIEEVIGGAVTLHQRGANLAGLCPFHPERTPSFFVFQESAPHFHCFGCGANGDVVSWLQLHDRLTFRQAIEALATRYHVPLPPRQSPIGGMPQTRSTAYRAMELRGGRVVRR